MLYTLRTVFYNNIMVVPFQSIQKQIEKAYSYQILAHS